MNTKTTKDVAAILNVNAERIEQWIARRQFLPGIRPKPGFGRDWTFADAARLAVFVHLVDRIGMNPKDAGLLTQIGLYLFKDDAAFFVAYRGHPAEHLIDTWHWDIVKKSELGNFLTSGCEYPKVLAAGHSAEVIAENSKKNLGPAHSAVIIDLDRLERDLVTGWGGC